MFIGAVSSRVGASISGPDIISAIVFASMAHIIAGQAGAEPDKAMSTLLAAQLISTALVGLAWLVLVRFRWTRVVAYMPVSVVLGFLGCIGYQVGVEAIRQAVGEDVWPHPGSWNFWRLLLPALFFGIGMFFVQRFHVFSTAVTLPLFLLGPTVLFYAIGIGGVGKSLSQLRARGWLYPVVNRTAFYVSYRYLDPSQVDGKALGMCVPEMIFLILIVSMDMLLKLKCTATDLRCEVDVEHSVRLNALETLSSLLVLGPPGYSQVHFYCLLLVIVMYDMSTRIASEEPDRE